MRYILIRRIQVFSALTAGLICLLLAACTEPSPLYGTWADNRGNTFTFLDDDTFNAKITSSDGIILNYEGKYSVLLNALTLSSTNVELRVVTEWDIRGNMLYLDWINEDGVPVSLTLYKISN